MVMDCSISSTSLKLSIFHASLLFFLFLFFYPNLVSSSATKFRYGHFCDSIVPESKPAHEEFDISPFPERQYGYYKGGGKVLDSSSNQNYGPASKYLVFETHHVYETDVEDVFKVEGNLIFQSSHYYEQSFSSDFSFPFYSSHSSNRGVLDFNFQGFWSTSTGKLCMVGSSYAYTKEGKLLHLAAVLKLNNVMDSSTINTLVTGTMDSLYHADGPNYFEQISLLMFPQGGYKYTKVSNQFSQGCPGGTDIPEKSSLSLSRSRTICNMFLARDDVFELVYPSDCDSSKSCNPFGDDIGHLPKVMSLSMIECSEDKLSLRFLIELSDGSDMGYYRSFNSNKSLVGEGSFDAKKNQLCVVACRIYDASSSFEKANVGDCTTRLSLRFPAILSIRNTSIVVGEIWSEKQRNESGFFDRIVFRNSDRNSRGIQLQGLKYEYMEMDKVKKLCPEKNHASNSRGKYPDGYSRDMDFSIASIKDSKGRKGWCSSKPFVVGDQPYQKFHSLIPSSSSMPINIGVESNTNGSLLNIGYKISFTLPSLESKSLLGLFSSIGNQETWISAEGFYDAETGNLCMVGCRDMMSDNNASFSQSIDCEILVDIHFPALDSDRKGSEIKGSIKSIRQKTDSLYFEPMDVTARANYCRWAKDSIWRMNFEVIMAVISSTLAIVFVVLQIFRIRKHPKVRPFISLLMLVILALGHLVPLVVNLEALVVQDSQRKVWIRAGTWLEMNEVIIRFVTMVAFLLQIRLLMLSWSARFSDEKKKALLIAERRVLYVCLPVYIAGGVIAFYMNTRNNPTSSEKHSLYNMGQIIWWASKAYAGLILDAFLFPQILFNMFRNSTEQPLSRFFYIGITLVRLVPHGYDLYRAHNYVDVDDLYMFADPTADYYSTAWDFIILVLGLFFASIIYFQQRFGGRCFLPKKLRESMIYDELPVASEEEELLKSSI